MSAGLSAGGLDARQLLAPLMEFDRVGLAVSGGADSLGLLLLAHEVAEAGNCHRRFVVYSVDHGLRPEAAGEVAFVMAEAERRGFTARALSWDGAKPATGVQQAAREARYRLFAAAMQADGATALATAHHLADQAETVLMRLAHGSGVEGLRGMDRFSEVGGITIVRPLLGVDPALLHELVAAAGLVPVADPSNGDLAYERVRWRQMLPQLAALGLDVGRLELFAKRMRDADRALEQMTAQAVALVDFTGRPGQAGFDRALFVSIPRAVAVRLLGRVLDRVGGSRKPRALAAVETLTERLLLEPALRRTTLHGCILRSSGGRIVVEREPGRAAAAARRKEPSLP